MVVVFAKHAGIFQELLSVQSGFDAFISHNFASQTGLCICPILEC